MVWKRKYAREEKLVMIPESLVRRFVIDRVAGEIIRLVASVCVCVCVCVYVRPFVCGCSPV